MSFFVALKTKIMNKNTIEESNSNDIEETVTQSPLVRRSDVDTQCKIFVSLILP